MCNDPVDLKRTLRSFEKKLIRKGWPPREEIKASKLYGSPRNKDIPKSFKYKTDPITPLGEIYSKLSLTPIEVDYISVKKANLTDTLKSAPYGIIYNYLAWKVLGFRLRVSIDVHLIVDARNKEIHNGKHFDGYVETKAFEAYPVPRRLTIQHLNSDESFGLRAVDYFSWGIFRKYEFGDDRFYRMFSKKLNRVNCQAWFYS